jgi:hypothetical protein
MEQAAGSKARATVNRGKGSRGNKGKAPGTAVRTSRAKPGMAFRGASATTTRAERFHEQTRKTRLSPLNIT